MKYDSQTFKRSKVQNLFITDGGVYYGRIKRKKKIHKRAFGTDFSTAQRKLKEFIDEVENKETLSGDIMFESLADQWVESLRLKSSLKTSSLLRRETCVNGIKPHFKGRMVREVDQDALRAWEAKRVREVAPRTFNIDRETIISIFNFAVAKEILSKNPAVVVRVGNVVKAGLEKKKTLTVKIVPPTREEFTELVSILDSHGKTKKSGLFVQFLAATGLRLTEARNVRWEDCDFTRGKIRITGGEEGTKNRRERSIPMFPKAKALLESIKPSQLNPKSPVFDVVTAKMALISASKKMGRAEGEHFTHHDLRHYFASNAAEKGIDFKVIADWLGHSDGGILAANTYSHLRQSHSDELAALMA